MVNWTRQSVGLVQSTSGHWLLTRLLFGAKKRFSVTKNLWREKYPMSNIALTQFSCLFYDTSMLAGPKSEQLPRKRRSASVWNVRNNDVNSRLSSYYRLRQRSSLPRSQRTASKRAILRKIPGNIFDQVRRMHRCLIEWIKLPAFLLRLSLCEETCNQWVCPNIICSKEASNKILVPGKSSRFWPNFLFSPPQRLLFLILFLVLVLSPTKPPLPMPPFTGCSILLLEWHSWLCTKIKWQCNQYRLMHDILSTGDTCSCAH